MLDQELLSQPVRVDLLTAERDKAAASVEWIRKRVKILEDLVTQTRHEEAEQAKAEAAATRQEAEGKHPLVIRLAEQNAALSEDVAAIASRLDELASQTASAISRARQIEADFKSARETIDIGGLSQELGHMLFLGSFRRQTKDREEAAAKIGVRRLSHRQEEKRLRDLEAYVTAIAAEASEETLVLRKELRELATERLVLLGKRVTVYIRALAISG